MEIAQVVAKRSTCVRLNVGALIVIDNRIRSIGFNGQPPGAEHCLGEECPGRVAGNCPTIHAERNALFHLDYTAAGYVRDLYVTDSPCVQCYDLAIGYEINRVFFQNPYRLSDHLSQGIPVYQVMPSGYIIDWRSKHLVDPESLK